MTASSMVSGVRRAVAVVSFFAAVGAASIASAVSFSGGYQVNALSSDPGLVVHTAELADPLNFVLNAPNDTYTVGLFDIWTNETAVNLDDFMPAGISVDFNFVTPASTGSVTGTTLAGTIIIGSAGVLTWDGPTVIDIGNGGKLLVSLSDELFNGGLGLSLRPGRENGATVQADFTLITDSVSEVPLPASLPLFAAALGGFALIRRRARPAA